MRFVTVTSFLVGTAIGTAIFTVAIGQPASTGFEHWWFQAAGGLGLALSIHLFEEK